MLALSRGRQWRKAKVVLRRSGVEIQESHGPFFGRRPPPITIELPAIQGFSLVEEDVIELRLKQVPGYGLSDIWSLRVKERDAWAEKLRLLGLQQL